MKVTIRYEEGTDAGLHSTLKVTLPKSWKSGPTINIKKTFIEQYNAKHGNVNNLEINSIHLLNPKGEQLADEEIVENVLEPSDTIRVKHGKAPTLQQVIEIRKGNKKFVAENVKKVKHHHGHGHSHGHDHEDEKEISEDEEGHVTNAAALKKAQEPKFAFDYSKWDKLDLSDEDGDDCHPNIDLESWKRLRGRQRKERREAEDKKLEKYKQKIEKYKKKAANYKTKLDKAKSEEEKAQIIVDLKDAEASQKEYEDKMENFLTTRKMIADDVCQVNDSKGVVAKDESPKAETATIPKYPESKQVEYDSYDSFQKANRKLLKVFSQIRSDIDSEDFLLANPQLLCDHAEGFLLILTLDTCMKHQLTDRDPTVKKSEEQIKKERLIEYTCGKQHLTVHYICELAKTLQRDVREAVKPFFTKNHPKSDDKRKGFEEDLDKFLIRIRNRAAEKIKLGEVTPLVDAESSLAQTKEVIYEPAGLGPGGLDPNEVLQKLPEDLQAAFVTQDTDKLKAAFAKLKPEEAEYWLKQCIDSGLWVVNKEGEDQHEMMTDEQLKEVLEGLPENVRKVFEEVENMESQAENEEEEVDEDAIKEKLKTALMELDEELRKETVEKCVKCGLMSPEFITEMDIGVKLELSNEDTQHDDAEQISNKSEAQSVEAEQRKEKENIMDHVLEEVDVD